MTSSIDEIAGGAAVAARLRDGDHHALAEAYSEWSAMVYTYALRRLGSVHDAEDVTQEVFVSAWRSRHTIRPGTASLAGWLVGIAKHRCADAHGRRARDRRDVEALSSVAGPAAQGGDADMVTSQVLVRGLIGELGHPRGEVIRLAFLEERTHEEIAEHLRMPLGTVKSHVRRGLLRLRDELQEVTHGTR